MNHPYAFAPARVEKPWGYEIIWAHTDRYVGKILHIEPGHLLSLQYHEQKHESIYVLRGRMIFRYRNEAGELAEREMIAGDAQQVPTGLVHQFEALERTDVLEASTPHLDDVVRLQDRYGRVEHRGTEAPGRRGAGERGEG
ncbi:MAG TPA: cupin domain-containing protein [Gemmatimonadales bacterium]|nr:cupin domain-containing protein [Gemmatimonadales bacterium]